MSSDINSVKNRFGIVGFHPHLISAIEIAIQVAPTDVPVLVQGENGTGKDVFSRIIHQYSRRKHQPFLSINTGAIPEGTMDSELFGHEKGSFTGAAGLRKGYFEEVDTGTIFMDEIGEMPRETQQRLLRVLENKEYLRVGSSKVRHTDVRVIAATNQNLIDLIRRGKFREDLFFRLNTVSIQVPPLRERGSDIVLLFHYFADDFAHRYRRDPLILTEEAAQLIAEYRWPGNVRELKNFVEKLTILVKSNIISDAVIREHLNIQNSYLPGLPLVTTSQEVGDKNQAHEIELLYKMILDLKGQVDEMKKMFFVNLQQPKRLPESAQADDRNIFVGEDSHAAPQLSYVGEGSYGIQGNPVQKGPGAILLPQTLNLEANEKDLITRALEKHTHNRKKAAQELGISERTLYRKIKQYDIS